MAPSTFITALYAIAFLIWWREQLKHAERVTLNLLPLDEPILGSQAPAPAPDDTDARTASILVVVACISLSAFFIPYALAAGWASGLKPRESLLTGEGVARAFKQRQHTLQQQQNYEIPVVLARERIAQLT